MRSLAALLGLALSGCAAISAVPPPTVVGVMHSAPPQPKDEVVPKVALGEIWVPGFYEPASGAWIWHPGRVVAKKPGFRVVEAQYLEQNSEFRVRLPYWEREPVARRPAGTWVSKEKAATPPLHDANLTNEVTSP
jgi:hypothetical protein